MIYCNIHTHSLSIYPDDITIVNQIVKEDIIHINAPLQSIGIHPWYIYNVREQMDKLSKLLSARDYIAIGEAGFDKTVQTPLDIQEEVFLLQAELAEQKEKPLIIHCVKAWNELIASNKKAKPRMPWVIHGFRGNGILAEQLIRQGFYLSFGEYFNPEALQVAWPAKIFAETDNKTIDIRTVYNNLASSLNLSLETFSQQINKNVQTIFSV